MIYKEKNENSQNPNAVTDKHANATPAVRSGTLPSEPHPNTKNKSKLTTNGDEHAKLRPPHPFPGFLWEEPF